VGDSIRAIEAIAASMPPVGLMGRATDAPSWQ
jgi:hypothetical protein